MTRDSDAEKVRKRHRARIDGGRAPSSPEGDEGVSLSVPSYADTGGVSDLGVDEPVVPEDVQGEQVADQPDPPVGKSVTPSRDDRDMGR